MDTTEFWRRGDRSELFTLPMGNGIVLENRWEDYIKQGYDYHWYSSFGTIVMTNTAGQETTLLESQCMALNPPNDCWLCMLGPVLVEVVNERYFLFEWRGYGLVQSSVFDIQTMQEHRIDIDGNWYVMFATQDENVFYFYTWTGDEREPAQFIAVEITLP